MVPKTGVVVVGEVVCDLYSMNDGQSLVDADALCPKLGGAPSNVAVQLARLGHRVDMVSAVGADPFGDRLMRLLQREGVGTGSIRRIRSSRTGLTLVEVAPDGERSFYPYREGSADALLSEADIPSDLISRRAVLHTGTVTRKSPSARRATEHAVTVAADAGVVISLDLNLRVRMWPSADALIAQAKIATKGADVIKATLEEARQLHPDASTPQDAARALVGEGAKLVLITLGSQGAWLQDQNAGTLVPAPQVEAVDATGAGDAFVGAALASLLDLSTARALSLDAILGTLDAADLEEIGRRACQAGAEATRARGATEAMISTTRQ